MNADRRTTSISSGLSRDRKTFYWISLCTGIPDLEKTGTMEQSRGHLTEWWQYSVERTSTQIHELPEDFKTTRTWRHIKFVNNYATRLKPIFNELQNGDSDLNESVDHLRNIFSNEEERLIQWKSALENLQGLILWIPAFSHAREYLFSAFPLDVKYTDDLCQSLIQSIRDPYRFLESEARERFDENFLKFKKKYIEQYNSLHEAIRNVVQDEKREESRVDPIAFRNLDLLSRLQYTDKSYLNRSNILARWIKSNQCSLAVSQILERYPRCYCNFNPCAIRQPTGPISQINGIIQEGIDYFRMVLSRCREVFEKEIQSQKMDDETSAQLNAFLGNGEMVPLKEQTIEALNNIIRKNPTYFHAKIRARTNPWFAEESEEGIPA